MFCPHLFEGVIVKRLIGIVEQISDQKAVQNRRDHGKDRLQHREYGFNIDKKEY